LNVEPGPVGGFEHFADAAGLCGSVHNQQSEFFVGHEVASNCLIVRDENLATGLRAMSARGAADYAPGR
jgi:hypothetical protein